MRILVIQTAFLGDMVLTLPLIDALRQHFSTAHIAVLTVPSQASLLQQYPGIDTVLPYDKRGTQRGLYGLLRMAQCIRAQRYDVVLSPHQSLRSALLVAGSGSPMRVGFTQWFTRWAYSTTVPRSATVHEVERNLRLLTVLAPAAGTTPARLHLPVTPSARQQAHAYFTASGRRPTAPVIGLVPGSQWGTKRWPAERFAALVERLSSEQQAQCVLFGSVQERPVAQAITAACRAPVWDLVGKTPVQELPAYLEQCTVVVGNDTGPMHIAAALGKPILVLYGPTTPALGFFPYGVRWEEASVALECRPCHAHGPQRCPLGHWRCMLDLSVDRVAAGVQRLLQPAAVSREVPG
jgi:heptosyltransferase-2